MKVGGLCEDSGAYLVVDIQYVHRSMTSGLATVPLAYTALTFTSISKQCKMLIHDSQLPCVVTSKCVSGLCVRLLYVNVFQAETSAVAQVVLASGSGSGHQVWSSRGSGVLCLVKDLSMCSYFLRLYCVKVRKQNMYNVPAVKGLECHL